MNEANRVIRAMKLYVAEIETAYTDSADLVDFGRVFERVLRDYDSSGTDASTFSRLMEDCLE